MKGPQRTTTRIPHDKIIPAAIFTIPPTGLYTLWTCQYVVHRAGQLQAFQVLA